MNDDLWAEYLALSVGAVDPMWVISSCSVVTVALYMMSLSRHLPFRGHDARSRQLHMLLLLGEELLERSWVGCTASAPGDESSCDAMRGDRRTILAGKLVALQAAG